MKNLGERRISYAAAALLLLLCIGASCFFTYQMLRSSPATAATATAEPTATEGASAGNDCNENVVTLKGYKLVKPILCKERECESKSLAPLQGDIANFILNQKTAGNISSASVYLKVLSTDDWTTVNADEPYFPGSLIKLPMLIAFLRMEEAKPGYLDQKVLFDGKGVVNVTQTYESKGIQPGHTYTIRQLLEYMIAYSDNNATQLLNKYMQFDAVNRVFTDLGLKPPPNNADYFKYQLSARDYSKFMLGIYNSTYLSNSASEYAAELLSKSDFADGLAKQLPPSVKIAHKFGEAATAAGRELHESGIIFINNKPYLITVMTRGADAKKLSEVVSQISKIVYDRLYVPAV